MGDGEAYGLIRQVSGFVTNIFSHILALISIPTHPDINMHMQPQSQADDFQGSSGGLSSCECPPWLTGSVSQSAQGSCTGAFSCKPHGQARKSAGSSCTRAQPLKAATGIRRGCEGGERGNEVCRIGRRSGLQASREAASVCAHKQGQRAGGRGRERLLQGSARS
jgi:hypothetical protein